MSLPPFVLVTEPGAWRACLQALRQEPRLALDLEANSMYAYRERVCLIQVSTPAQDFIIDPLAPLDLSGLGRLIADPDVEKIFHAAEYDLILLKRQYGWELQNLFDTMWAARILGLERYGLANLLQQFYGVELDKRYQKSNWCRRPLSDEQLVYAQHDTHYLFRLRKRLGQEIAAHGWATEAREIFAEQSQVSVPHNGFDPNDFWSINGAHKLTRRQQAVLRELAIFRDNEARERDQPLFKIFGDRTLIELAQRMPASLEDLEDVHGMSRGQIRRYGRSLLGVISDGKHARPPALRRRKNSRQSEAVTARYERLHLWRKQRAISRGVESDVIISRDALWEIAEANPRSREELRALRSVGEWRCETYSDEILRVLHDTG